MIFSFPEVASGGQELLGLMKDTPYVGFRRHWQRLLLRRTARCSRAELPAIQTTSDRDPALLAASSPAAVMHVRPPPASTEKHVDLRLLRTGPRHQRLASPQVHDGQDRLDTFAPTHDLSSHLGRATPREAKFEEDCPTAGLRRSTYVFRRWPNLCISVLCARLGHVLEAYFHLSLVCGKHVREVWTS